MVTNRGHQCWQILNNVYLHFGLVEIHQVYLALCLSVVCNRSGLNSARSRGTRGHVIPMTRGLLVRRNPALWSRISQHSSHLSKDPPSVGDAHSFQRILFVVLYMDSS